MTGPLLTPAQAAEQLQVTESWLKRAAGRGEIPHVKLGSRIRFRTEDLDAIVAAAVRLPDTTTPDVIPARQRAATPLPDDSNITVLRNRPEMARCKPRTTA